MKPPFLDHSCWHDLTTLPPRFPPYCIGQNAHSTPERGPAAAVRTAPILGAAVPHLRALTALQSRLLGCSPRRCGLKGRGPDSTRLGRHHFGLPCTALAPESAHASSQVQSYRAGLRLRLHPISRGAVEANGRN